MTCPRPPRPVALAARACSAWLALPALLLATLPASAGTPVELPAPRAAGKSSAARASAPVAASAAAQRGVAPEAAAPVADPMEQLRLRLAERLSAQGRGQASGTLDLQVGTRGPAHGPAHGPAPSAPRATGAGAGAPATPSAQDIAHGRAEGIAWSRPPGGAPAHRVSAPAEHGAAPARVAAAQAHAGARRSTSGPKGHAAGAVEHPHWAYEGAGGPASWGALKPEFGLCANGQRQSPIDIRGGLAVDLEPVKFDYRPSGFSVIDNGHTVQVNVPPGNAIEVAGRRFELVQFHFHRPSEERIDGRQFEMSLHLVHKDPAGRLAVVGVLLGKGPAHPAVQTVWNNLPLERNEEVPARAQIDPTHLLPEDRRYYTYMGSLTTPPCSEGVHWVVMRTPVTVTPEQIELFARIYPMNARPVQSAAGRRILQSQ